MSDNNGGLLTSDGSLFNSPTGTIIFSHPENKFRESINAIEGKTWFELDVTTADTIVIIQDGKKVVMNKKDFLQKVGLEW